MSSSAISAVAIANMAANTLEDERIDSLTQDDSSLARFIFSEYAIIRDELLRLHPWVFAKTRAILTPDATAPEFGWAYQYSLPSNWLRMLEVRENGNFNGREVVGEREGRKFLTNTGTRLYAKGIRRVTSEEEFDPLFARAFGQLLAVRAAQRVTGKTSYLEKALAFYRDSLQSAIHVNALDWGSVEGQDRADILDVRLGG